MADCLPSVSGRGLAPSAPHVQRYRRPSAAVRAGRPILSSSSFPLSMDQAAETSDPPTARPRKQDTSFNPSMLPRPQSQRDAQGRSLAGRKKPLKINLDLALVSFSTKFRHFFGQISHIMHHQSIHHILICIIFLFLQYRARQTRVEATRARDPNERSKLLREAEAALRRCLDMDPEDGRAYVSLGKLMVGQRRFDEALALYEAGSAATGGTNAHIWTAWAYLAGRRGNAALARRLYDAAIVAAPGHAAAYHGWGLLEKDQGNYSRARDVWTRGIAATAASPNPYLFQSLAVLAADLARPDEARKWFRAGTRTVSGAASHALWQAWALMEKRNGTDPEAVRVLFRRGLEASPRSRYTFLSWALWEKEQGNIEEARRLFKQGSYLNPRDAALPQAWALMEEETGDVETARRLFRRASKADPSHLYVWQAWGCMEARAGALDAARELFQQGIWAAPPRAKDVSLVFQAWAVLERDAGNAELARELFKCAVKADPSSEPSWLAWADMEEELGSFERANELRSFSMQERQFVVAPANFTTLPRAERAGLLGPVFDQLSKWFQRYEAAAMPAAGYPPGLFDSTDSEGEGGEGTVQVPPLPPTNRA